MRTLFIVGRDEFLIASMRVALRCSRGVKVLGMRGHEAELAPALREAMPDIVLIDAATHAQRALDHLREVCEECPEALVVVVAPELHVDLFTEVSARGALACVGTVALVSRLHTLLAGPPHEGDEGAPVALAVARPAGPGAAIEPESPLTTRELEILRAVAEGHTSAHIGRELWITEQTVKFHLSKIYRKLGVANRTEASRYLLLNGLAAAPAPRRPRPAPEREPSRAHRNANGLRLLGQA